ncbi:MAG: Ig-like domain-containing protein [Reichenbachiella sp.]|uniref:Ig-like domain-containing protein n=3 Tax=Reichenbachiella sp. TaxID=2184521 RepID=UPI0032641E2B
MKTLIQHTKREASLDYQKGSKNSRVALLWPIKPNSITISPRFRNNKFKREMFLNSVACMVLTGTIIALILLSTSWASAQNVNIPDANFKSALVANTAINTNGDEEIQVSEAASYSGTIYVSSRDITNLTGIEAFVNITGLDCSSNQLTSLDISTNTALTTLRCFRNQLTSLDASASTNLNILDCYHNQLKSLDIGNNGVLDYLNCQNNLLTSLDVSANTALTRLYCTTNLLTNLDVSTNTTLSVLGCYENRLTTLDVSMNTGLTYLSCGGNQLTTLNVGNNTALIGIECNANQLISLDISANTALVSLSCSKNQLTSLDLQTNTLLEELSSDYNQLTTLDVSSNTALTELNCSFNQLTALDLSKNLVLEQLNCSNSEDGRDKKSLDLGDDVASRQSGTGNRITSLDLRANVALRSLYCSDNQLGHLDLRNGSNASMWTVSVQNNDLTCIIVDDVSANHSKWQKDKETTYCSDVPPSAVITSHAIETNKSPFGVTITFGEEVNGFELSDIEVSNGTANQLQTSDNIVYSIDITPLAEGPVVLSISENRATDLDGDPNAEAQEFTINYDITPPRATIMTGDAIALPVPVTIAFSEEVSDFELADLVLDNCTADNVQSTDNKTFNLEITPLASGIVTIDLAADKVTDLAGNLNMAAARFGIRYEAILGLSDEEKNEVSLYPNPVTSGLFIETKNYQQYKEGSNQIALIDVRGKQLLAQRINPMLKTPAFIDMQAYPTGLYFLLINIGGTSITKKVLKN